MKKIFIALALVFAFTTMQAQKKSIVGIWIYAEKNTIVEFTKNQYGKYGNDKTEYTNYKIVGNKIVFPDKEPIKFKWRGKNTLIINDGEEKKLQRIIPTQNKILWQGTYYVTKDITSYLIIKDASNAEIFEKEGNLFIKYLVVGNELYMANKGFYLTLEIKDERTLQYNSENDEIYVYKLVTPEEFKEKNLFAEVASHYDNEEFNEAIELAQQAIAKYPNDVRFYYALCSAYSKQGDYQKAIDISNRVMEIDTTRVSTLGNLSFYYLFTKEYDKAEQSARKALEIDDSELWIQANLATALLFQGRYEEAESIFLELKDKYCFESKDKTCAKAWLEDFDKLEEADAIPENQMENVQEIRKILDAYWKEKLTNTQKQKVEEVVKIWFEEMIYANIYRVMEVSDVPFAYDMQRLIKTYDKLREKYLEFFKDKAPRAIPTYKVEIIDYESYVYFNFIPINVAQVLIKIPDEKGNVEEVVELTVLIRDNIYKIVGFTWY